MDQSEPFLENEAHDNADKSRVHEIVGLIEHDVEWWGTRPACRSKGLRQARRTGKDLPEEKDIGSPYAGNKQMSTPLATEAVRNESVAVPSTSHPLNANLQG